MPRIITLTPNPTYDFAVDAPKVYRNGHGRPRKPFYVTGRVGDQAFSVHAEGERMILTRANGTREEVAMEKPADGDPAELAMTAPAEPAEALPPPVCPQGIAPDLLGADMPELAGPGESPLDQVLPDSGQADEPDSAKGGEA